MTTFAEIAAGTNVFLDANTFIYYFIAQPQFGAACTAILERIEHHDIIGWTSAHILAEVSHRLMTIEACSRFGWPYQNIASRLRTRPQDVQQLVGFRDAPVQIGRLPLKSIAVTSHHVLKATQVSQQDGLLTNDALLIAIMQDQGLVCLASNEADLDRLKGMTRYAPV